jgi:heat shock protein HslJ/uncharacterized membrane protein
MGTLLLFIGCIENKKSPPEENEAIEKTTDTVQKQVRKMEALAVTPDGSYFKATGTEPFWGLKILENSVELNMMEDTIYTPHAEPIKAQDSNISMYRIQTEAVELDVIIAHKECTNAMSGEKSPYTVTIAYKYTGEEETHALEGCGSYITDYRLHDIWVLEEMDGQAVTKDDFNGRDVPNMEIDIKTNRFSGFAGCNRMTGGLFFEKDLLRFTNAASTKMACPNMDAESAFLKNLQSGTTYKIENNRLYLSNGSQENLLIFKKID